MAVIYFHQISRGVHLVRRQRPALIIVLARGVIDEPIVYIRYMCKPGT